MFRGGARILVRKGGNIGQNFIHDFSLSPVLQWRRKNYGSGGGETFRKNVLIKDF